MSNWFMDKITNGNSDNLEVAKRFDGKFNLWRRHVDFSTKNGFTSYWEVVGVFDTEKQGLAGKAKFVS